MNPVLDELFKQHRDAERMLADLKAASDLLRSGATDQALPLLAGCRDAIRTEVKSHFAEEEQALFPVMGRWIPIDEGPIAMLMDEHRTFRTLQGLFEEALAGLEAGQESEWRERLLESSDRIVELLAQHIEKEDTVLFPMAETLLDEADWERVKTLRLHASVVA